MFLAAQKVQYPECKETMRLQITRQLIVENNTNNTKPGSVIYFRPSLFSLKVATRFESFEVVQLSAGTRVLE